MPTYEYECKSCGHGFEIFQAMSDPPLKDCPQCGREVRRLIFGGAGVIFKGSGFYVTDKSPAAKTEAKPAAENKAACSGCPAKGDAAACPASSSKNNESAGQSKPEKEAKTA